MKKVLTDGGLHSLTLMAEKRVLLQTLAEIKEIAESEMDSKEFMAVQYMLNGSVDNKNKVLKQILQKINEVENEKESNTAVIVRAAQHSCGNTHFRISEF